MPRTRKNGTQGGGYSRFGCYACKRRKGQPKEMKFCEFGVNEKGQGEKVRMESATVVECDLNRHANSFQRRVPIRTV